MLIVRLNDKLLYSYTVLWFESMFPFLQLIFLYLYKKEGNLGWLIIINRQGHSAKRFKSRVKTKHFSTVGLVSPGWIGTRSPNSLWPLLDLDSDSDSGLMDLDSYSDSGPMDSDSHLMDSDSGLMDSDSDSDSGLVDSDSRVWIHSNTARKCSYLLKQNQSAKRNNHFW